MPEKCTAKSSRTGERCGRWPSRGALVCTSHGARAPQVRAAAARNLAQEQVRKLASEIVAQASPVTDPLTALQQYAGRAQAWETALAEQVDVLKLGYSSEVGTEQIRAAVQLYTQAMRETRETLAAMGRLNIDARLIAIREGTRDMVLRALQAGLVAVGITGPAQATALAAAGRELRIIANEGGGAGC